MFDDVAAVIEEIERLEIESRRLAARQVELLGEIELMGAHHADGHASAKVMVRHVARLSGATAASRDRIAKMMLTLPEVADAFRGGTIGTDQMALLGRVHANRRVRDFMVDAQGWFLRHARRMSYRDFEIAVREWERLADEDGAEPNERMHQARRVRLTQDEQALTWELDGRMGAAMGAAIDEIFQHYLSAERLADWEKAKAEHGELAHEGDLPRTEAQRSADALWQVFQDAAAADESCVSADFTHSIVWSATAYEEMLRRLDGEAPRPIDPDEFRCETGNGVPLEPLEAAAQSLVQKVRRVIVDAAGTVIDQGRARRFTGSARSAARIQSTHCLWPGCHVPAGQCEIDHTVEHGRGGRTNPGNGGPVCGRHNRLKQNGYRVWRDPAGEWHTYRPNGTEIPN